ncbi:hypothetical protein [Aeoliella sp. SH292]|uniref:hypothetical protein n=1 Tax=Aeoliella sp. SH292 TaxID=3454464 RepID=UPI003F947EBC
MGGNHLAYQGRFNQSAIRIGAVILLSLVAVWLAMRWPDWQRRSLVRQASHVVVSLHRQESKHYLFEGEASQEIADFVFHRSRPYFETMAMAYPISMYFFDGDKGCLFSCRVKAGDIESAEDFVNKVRSGVEVSEQELDDMFTTSEYEKNTRKF